MSYESEIIDMAELGASKATGCRSHQIKYFIGGMQAGAYVGIAIILIMTLGAAAPEGFKGLIMGGTFGLALILVVIAGAELFTGYNLYTAISVRQKTLSVAHAVEANTLIFFSNFIGSLLLVLVYWAGKGTLTHGVHADFIQAVSANKMNHDASVLVARGALCNWLVCLALWMSRRVNSDSAKCIVIGWCLLAFISSGFEHSVANMTVHLLALFGPENPQVSIPGAAHNLLWVTLGNIIGGALFVGLAYSSQYNKDSDTSTN